MKTTDAHFAYFKKECEKWIDRLHLRDWRVDYSHKPLDEGWRASCTTGYAAMRATIALATGYPQRVTREALREDALHEALEIMLSTIKAIGRSRYVMEDEFDKEGHAIIHRLMPLLEGRR